jgi:Flp pilus assembly CpaF family ATPase
LALSAETLCRRWSSPRGCVHLEDLVRVGTLTRGAVRFLDASVVAGLNILVAGGTQSGNPASC